MPARSVPAVRSVVATSEIVVFSAAAHVGAGGSLPSLGHLLALVAVVGAVSAALRHHVLRPWTAATLASSGQIALHLMATGSPGHGGPSGHGGHGHQLVASGTSTEMLLAHVLSVVATVLALLWQEQVVQAAVGLLTARVIGPLLVAGLAWRPVGPPPLRRRTTSLLSVAPRRGPPVLPAFAWS